ncbi:MAG: cation transporter [Dehalococcoidales bacterium]|nr:cation transporter [Dehalococcoidales bacterium]
MFGPAGKGQANLRMKTRTGEPAGWLIFLDIFFFAAGLIAGILTGSLSLTALAVFSGIDILKSAVRTVPAGNTPLSKEHKINTVLNRLPAALMTIEGILFILAAVFVFREAGRRLDEAVPPGQFYAAIAVLSVYLLTALSVSIIPVTTKKDLRLHSRLEIALSLVVLAVLISAQIARIQSLDPVVSIFLSVLIIFKSLRLLLDSLKQVLENRLPSSELEWIKGIIQDYAGEEYSVQDLTARQSGNKCWIDFGLAVSSTIDLEKAFETAGGLEKELMRKIPGAIVIIHVRK